MTRMTNDLRDIMTREILLYAHRAEGEALCTESNQLFFLVHHDIYDSDTLSLMAKLSARHKDAFPVTSARRVNVNGYSIRIGAQVIGSESVAYYEHADKVWYIRSVEDQIHYGSDAIGQKIEDFATRRVAFEGRLKTQYIQLRATLNALKTTQQIADQWPEAWPLIEKHLPVSAAQLPAIPFAEMNAKFGLPPVEVANG